MLLVQAFAIPVYYQRIESGEKIVAGLIDLGRESERNRGFRSRSNRGGFQSELIDSGNEVVAEFYRRVKVHIAGALMQLRPKSELDIVFGRPWININRKGNFNIDHVHPGAEFSCVYYLKVPQDSGNLVFLTILRI